MGDFLLCPFLFSGDNMSAWTNFRDQALSKATGAAASGNSAAGDTSFSGGLMDAIYQFGRGKGETAVQNLTAAFRKTGVGKKLEATATQQKISELMPFIIGGAIILLLGGFLLARRR